jgi:hypothetical protein
MTEDNRRVPMDLSIALADATAALQFYASSERYKPNYAPDGDKGPSRKGKPRCLR